MTPSWATAMAEMAWKRALEERRVSALLRVPSSLRVAPELRLEPAAPAVVLAPRSTVVVVVGPVDIKLPPATMPARVAELAPPAVPPKPAAARAELPHTQGPLLLMMPRLMPLALAELPLFPFPPDGVVGVVPPLLRVGFTVVEYAPPLPTVKPLAAEPLLPFPIAQSQVCVLLKGEREK